MQRRTVFFSFTGGVLTTLALVIVLAGGQDVPRAHAQVAAAPNTVGRYQVSSWALPGIQGIMPKHGAYILDTETGQAWEIRENQPPNAIGKIR